MTGWYIDVVLDQIPARVEFAAVQKAEVNLLQAREEAEHARRSLGQRFRRLRESAIEAMWGADYAGDEDEHYNGAPGRDCPECGKALEHEDCGESWCTCGYACMEEW